MNAGKCNAKIINVFEKDRNAKLVAERLLGCDLHPTADYEQFTNVRLPPQLRTVQQLRIRVSHDSR